MSDPQPAPRDNRETRLLLVTIVVSVGVLLLLSRFRFPEEAATPAVSAAPAPLERLAARAVYDELASTMADLERRIVPRVTIVRVREESGGESFAVAPRLLPDRAVAVVEGRVEGGADDAELVGHDGDRSLVVLKVPSGDDDVVTVRQGVPRAGPRYAAAVDASPAGPVVRPLYIARVEAGNDEKGRPTLLLSGLQQPLAKGTAVFALDGALLGLVLVPGYSAVLLPAETLPAAIVDAQPVEARPTCSLGIEVREITPALARATGTDQGVIVVQVLAGGPASGIVQPGDVLQSVDDSGVTTVEGYRSAERACAPGSQVRITVQRRRKSLDLSLPVVAVEGPMAPTPPKTETPGFVGRSVAGAGIEVVHVEETGAAHAAGLSRGDLILTVDGEPARDVAVLARRFRSTDRSAGIVLTVQRGELHLVLALEKP